MRKFSARGVSEKLSWKSWMFVYSASISASPLTQGLSLLSQLWLTNLGCPLPLFRILQSWISRHTPLLLELFPLLGVGFLIHAMCPFASCNPWSQIVQNKGLFFLILFFYFYNLWSLEVEPDWILDASPFQQWLVHLANILEPGCAGLLEDSGFLVDLVVYFSASCVRVHLS